MASKVRNVSDKKAVCLKAIEELLKQQRVETERRTLITISLAVILAGISFAIIPIISTHAAAYYGLFLILLGALVFVLRTKIAKR